MGDAHEARFGSGSGAPSFKFGDTPGTTVSGIITHTDAIQSRKYGTNELEFWPSGDRKMIAILTVATDLRDPAIEDDDGQRAVWIRGKAMNEAVKAATRDAGAKGVDVGGQLFIRFTGLGKAEKGAQPPKLYEAGYRKPTADTRAIAASYKRPTGGNDDPWADQPHDEAFAPSGAVAPSGWPSAAPVAAPAAPAAGGWPPSAQAAPAAVQGAPAAAAPEVVTLPTGGTVDLSTLPPEAAALMRKMAGTTAAQG
jgi:hypothetical protein